MEFCEPQNTITEIQSSVDELKSRRERTEERICKLKDRMIEVIQPEQHRENRWKWWGGDKQSLRDNKRCNTFIFGVLDREEKRQE